MRKLFCKITVTTAVTALTMIVLTACLCTGVQAQTAPQLADKIIEASSKIKTLSCNFTQTRHVSLMAEDIVSKGVMKYESPARLKWEYISPQSIVLSVNAEDVNVTVDGNPLPPTAQSARMYKEISRFLMGSVSGNMLKDEKLFDISLKENDGGIITAVLSPKKGDLKRMYTSITMYFRTTDYTATRILLTEANGDSTEIVFSQTKITR